MGSLEVRRVVMKVAGKEAGKYGVVIKVAGKRLIKAFTITGPKLLTVIKRIKIGWRS